MEPNAKKFTGVFIPAKIFNNTELTWSEKILWCEIQALAGEDGCFASNDYLGEKMGISATKISEKISKLKKLGLVKQVGFDGRRRKLIVCFDVEAALPETDGQPSRKGEPCIHEKVNPLYIDENNRKDIKRESVIERPPSLQEVFDYGKQMYDTQGMGGFYCTRDMAEAFWANYEANGWILGNEFKTPVRNWKAKLRQWCLKEVIRAEADGIPVRPKGVK